MYFEGNLDGNGLRICIVMSRFYEEVANVMLPAVQDELQRLSVDDVDVTVVSVPGALEMPLVLQAIAQSGKVDALIALGSVMRGETYHFEVVANGACQGIMDVQLKTGVPIINGVLTCENAEQVRARMAQKGTDCATIAVEMARLQVNIRKQLDQL